MRHVSLRYVAIQLLSLAVAGLMTTAAYARNDMELSGRSRHDAPGVKHLVLMHG